MTAIINRDSKFLSSSIVAGRNVLLAWTKSNDVADIARRDDVQESVPNVIALLSEFEANGLIGRDFKYPDAMELTVKGRGLAYASAKPRTPKSKAQTALSKFLKRVVNSQSIENFPRRVTKVWLFGSMIDDSKMDVGDIDVVVESIRNDAYKAQKWSDVKESLIERFSDLIPQTAIDEDRHLDSVALDSFIFGKGNTLFAQSDVYMLRDLHVPCRLIYDSERGGIVDDPTLPHHPKSTGRGDNLYPRLEAPSLKQSGELSNARFLLNGYVPVRTQEVWKKLNPYKEVYGYIVTNTDDLDEMKQRLRIPKTAQFHFDGVNGRDEFLIWFTDSTKSKAGPKGWVSIKRSPLIDPDDRSAPDGRMSINCSITFHSMSDEEEFNAGHAHWVGAAVKTMLEADIKLLHERTVVTGEDMIISAKTDVEVNSLAGTVLFAELATTPVNHLFSNVERSSDRYFSSVEAFHPNVPHFSLIKHQGVAA